MINVILGSIFSSEMYTSRVDRLKANFLYTLIGFMSVVVVFVGVIGISDGGVVSASIPIVAIVILVVVYGLIRSGQLNTANWIMVIAMLVIIVTNNILDGSVGTLTIMLNSLLLIIAGFTLGIRGIVLITLANIIQIFAFGRIEGLTDSSWLSGIPLAVIYLIMGFVVNTYNEFIQANRLEGRDVEGVERLKLAELNMSITQQASTRESLQTALNSTLNLILENYPAIYHAQVFLIDNDDIQARLIASTGEIGQRLIEKAHSLAVGSLSVIGQTTFTGEPVVALPGQKDSVHRANDLLPLTKLEVAFPLKADEKIIGALDLQSQVLEELNDNDRLTFQSLANSLSLTIDNIRQFEQAKVRIEENQQLTEQTRTALREVERLNQRLIGRAWSEYVKDQSETPGVAVDFGENTTQSFDGWTGTLIEAVDSKNVVQEENIIAIPLRVRGQVVGAMEFELDQDKEFTPEDLELIVEISERFGLAAENTRLVEESQRSAQRATMINQMTSRFQSAQNVEATLAEAARSLSDTLSAGKVMIRLGVPENHSNGKDD